ncbi:hypothetical protein [Haloferax sp. Atlit-4N]|uniref:hypothetical protein n=1 Tax=Haloferax sp. Atlit-4N TaxID=2077206 RepID=UPI0011C03B7B|nr:hypothetical protein [Haloferax sp. Atlit-4N]
MSDPFAQKPATADYVLREGDSAPTLDATLKDLDGGVVDLTNADEVRLFVKRETDDNTVLNDTVSVTDAAAGEVSYSFSGGFSTTGAGMHLLYFRVAYSDGTDATYPRGSALSLFVPERFSGDIGTLSLDVVVDSIGVRETLDMEGNPISNQGVESVPDATALADGQPGFYRLQDTGDVVYFDGDLSTN